MHTIKISSISAFWKYSLATLHPLRVDNNMINRYTECILSNAHFMTAFPGLNLICALNSICANLQQALENDKPVERKKKKEFKTSPCIEGMAKNTVMYFYHVMKNGVF